MIAINHAPAMIDACITTIAVMITTKNVVATQTL